jgi:hypothetical protein
MCPPANKCTLTRQLTVTPQRNASYLVLAPKASFTSAALPFSSMDKLHYYADAFRSYKSIIRREILLTVRPEVQILVPSNPANPGLPSSVLVVPVIQSASAYCDRYKFSDTLWIYSPRKQIVPAYSAQTNLVTPR